MSTVKVISDCFVGSPGGPRRLVAGAEFDEADPLVTASPALFSEAVEEPKRPTLGRGKAKPTDG